MKALSAKSKLLTSRGITRRCQKNVEVKILEHMLTLNLRSLNPKTTNSKVLTPWYYLLGWLNAQNFDLEYPPRFEDLKIQSFKFWRSS